MFLSIDVLTFLNIQACRKVIEGSRSIYCTIPNLEEPLFLDEEGPGLNITKQNNGNSSIRKESNGTGRIMNQNLCLINQRILLLKYSMSLQSKI